MSDNTYAVIMAGGRGERFWPLSTASQPKQLLSLVGTKPLITMAVERMEGLVPPERILIITNAALLEAVCEAAPQIPTANVIGEPCGRDTAAAVALASAIISKRSPAGVFAILTADHVIKDPDVLRHFLGQCFEVAATQDVLITIGMQPTSPSTGFGYIEASDVAESREGVEFLKAKRFVEKPDRTTAKEYMDSGTFYWNSGMFVWSVQAIQKALGRHAPDLLAMAQKVEPSVDSDAFDEVLAKEYETLQKISVDYAIMEKSDNILMAKGAFSWDDVGSWAALANHFEPDDNGNTLIGDAEHVDSEGNIVVSNDRLTTLIGVRDLVVVQAGEATLICPKDRAEDVKKIVAALRQTGKYDRLL